MPETETTPHVMRLGWSVDCSPLVLGEVPLSYGYGGTGRASCNNNFFHYGERYSTDDVITCYIDLDAVPKTIFFAKNGKYLDIAFRLGPEANGKVFFPHVSVKNMRFVANFGRFEPYFPPIQGFNLIERLPAQILCCPPAAPRDRRECEVIMMVGLPSSGKTTWIKEYVKNHPEKNYNVLGSNDILVKMKVMGLNRRKNYHGRWDALIKQATDILNEMFKLAKNKNRNYILDQTNVYPGARRKKMSNFRGCRRIAAVVVNENSVLMQRNDVAVHRDGKVIPESAFMEMKSNFVLPAKGDVFDEIWYVEETEEKSRHLVREFNEEARKWKEEQKKRSIDEEQGKRESVSLDFKKTKFEDSAISNQSQNQYGARDHGPVGDSSRPPIVNQGGMFKFQFQGSPPDDKSWQDNYRQQPNQSAHLQSQQPNQTLHRQGQQQQYNEHNRERNQPDRKRSFGKSEYSYNQSQGTGGSQDYKGFHQGQQESSDIGGYQKSKCDQRFKRDHPRGSWSEGVPYQEQQRNNYGFHPPGHGDGRFSRGNEGNNYTRPAHPHGGWRERGRHEEQYPIAQQGGRNYPSNDQRPYSQHSQNESYPRRGDDTESHNNSSRGYPVKQESKESAQGPCENPNQGYERNQPGRYDATQNYEAQISFGNPSFSYQGSTQSWSTQQQGDTQSQGYWVGGPGWSLEQGPQGYDRSQPNVSQETRQNNWNQNQSYQQGRPQNYQY